MFRSRPASLALVGLFLWVSGCHKWVPLEQPYAPLRGEYEKLRVKSHRGAQVVLEEALVEADTVRGTTVTSYWERGNLKQSEQVVAIPIDSVEKIESREPDIGATIGLAVGIPATILVIALIAYASSGSL